MSANFSKFPLKLNSLCYSLVLPVFTVLLQEKEQRADGEAASEAAVAPRPLALAAAAAVPWAMTQCYCEFSSNFIQMSQIFH